MRHLTMSTRMRNASRWLETALLAAFVLALTPTPAAAQAEVIEYYATDAVGSTRVVFAPDGNVKARSDYLPFGEALGTTGSLPAQRFTGQERDGEAGLDNFNARAMVVRAGRFSAVDPVGGSIASPQTWNRYAYVRNNPLGRVDPSGGYDGPVATPTTNCRQEAGAYWCPGSLFIPSSFNPSSVDVLFNPDRQGYRGGEEMGMAEAQYGSDVMMAFLEARERANAPPPTPIVTTAENVTQVDGHRAARTADGGYCILCVESTAIESADLDLFGLFLPVGRIGAAALGRVTVTTFTDAAGVQAIQRSGTIGTASNPAWVTFPSATRGMGSQAVERALEIGPGRGGFSFTFSTSRSNLLVPHNGPLTSGGAPQFRLATPVPTGATILRVTPK